MTYDDLTVLIPSHSLEDFPQDLGESQAASLLNAFAVLWHPILLSGNAFPRWERADSGSEVRPGRLVIVPTCCDHIPGGWLERSQREGMTVVRDLEDRQAMLEAVLAPLEELPAVDPDLVADFLALGTCHLLTELLSRKMRHFSHLDEAHLRRESIAAAQAALANDADTARQRLKHCFDMLQEARERVYGVDCYLIDLCLCSPQVSMDTLTERLRYPAHINLLVNGLDLEQILSERPELKEVLQAALQEDRVDLIGGEWEEVPTSILALDSIEWQLRRGLTKAVELVGRSSTTWGRRRYGLSRRLPQLLARFGYKGALHVALDDGLYPDDEQTRLHWEGPDGTAVEAFSRIPLAADTAATFLRFPQRMSESMDHDHAAAVALARWPDLKTPWMEDFYRIARYAPVLGRFVTFTEFFQVTDITGRLANFHEGDYLSPFLVQSVARREVDPITRYADYWRRRSDFLAAEFCAGLSDLLTSQNVPTGGPRQEVEDLVEAAHPEAPQETLQQADIRLRDFLRQETSRLADLIMTSGGTQPGWLVINPHSFSRRVALDWPADSHFPTTETPIIARQFDETHHAAVVELPACGYVWIPRPADPSVPTQPGKVLTAEPLLLRNEFFEVGVSDATGGISHIKPYTRSPNRLSQQLAFRFPKPRKVTNPADPDGPPTESYYSEMRLADSRVLCSGPGLGELETWGELVDQVDGSVLAKFRQWIRVWRGRPVVELEIEIDPIKLPEGDPWTNYIASRFAWKHETAVLSRSDQHAPREVRHERMESPEFIEIADGDDRTTILPRGLPFHRKTGERMLDTLLIVAGETRRHFSMQVMIDVPFPWQAALDGMAPPLFLPTAGGPPRSGAMGWFFHLDAPHVQLVRILPLRNPPASATTAESSAAPAPRGCVLRLMETEGRRTVCRLHPPFPPRSARQVDLTGNTVSLPKVEGDEVRVEIAACEVCDIELTFGTK